MNKKQIDSTAIENELKGASLFFQQASQSTQKSPTSDEPVSRKAAEHGKPVESVVSQPASEPETTDGTMQPLEEQLPPDPTSQASKQEAMQAIKLASYHASNQAAMIEEIRRVVKAIGAKTTFVRLTPEEKNRLLEVVYIYKRQGVKTSENELVRIAIGYLLDDYNERGSKSMLANVLAALNA